MSVRKLMCKRLFDIALSSVLLLLLSPVLLITAFLVRLKLGAPVLFRQDRPGYQARTFSICKFRTMKSVTTKTADVSLDATRMTPLGVILRNYSLDELPQLWNVFKGDMSFVGPRPLLLQYVKRYNKEQTRRMNVKPGITGWAQINGRNAISWGEKFKLDVWYVDHQSFLLDMKILWLTLMKVVKRSDISQDGSVTMGEFMGNDS
jgi:sugar transferase EpsL